MGNLNARPRSPAERLASIITSHIDGESSISAAAVSKMLRNNWSIISPLAHTIHEEEVSGDEALEIRERSELCRLKRKYEVNCS